MKKKPMPKLPSLKPALRRLDALIAKNKLAKRKGTPRIDRIEKRLDRIEAALLRVRRVKAKKAA